MRRAWLVSVLFVCAACGPKKIPSAGVVVVFAADATLRSGAWADAGVPAGSVLHVGVRSGDRAITYAASDYLIPPHALPASLAIMSDGDPTASAILDVSLSVPDGPSAPLVDSREYAIAHLPTDRFAELDVVFDARCAGVSCPDGETCDGSGGCAASAVDGPTLPAFQGGSGTLQPIETRAQDGGPDADADDGGDGGDGAHAAACSEGAARCAVNTPQTCHAGMWTNETECAKGRTHCVDGSCRPVPPSCASAPTGGGYDCGAGGNVDCCASHLVTGGTFLRDYDGITYDDATHPATVSTLRLDAFEITVGRFRKFVIAASAGWTPTAGSGKHTHLNGGSGLVDPTGGFESGWDVAWNNLLPSGATDWDQRLSSCLSSVEDPVSTWTPTAAATDTRPIVCLDWYEAYAFCIWDGGADADTFLPSDAEWNFAAAAGDQQREFPWGNVVPANDTSLAIYSCIYGGTFCPTVANVAPVGSAPLGNGFFGQSDLGGNAYEWNLDTTASPGVLPAGPCDDCTGPAGAALRGVRGGCFRTAAQDLLVANAWWADSQARSGEIGARCARLP
jgi:formylglycine-generating enzyme required for sulfatase activity